MRSVFEKAERILSGLNASWLKVQVFTPPEGFLGPLLSSINAIVRDLHTRRRYSSASIVPGVLVSGNTLYVSFTGSDEALRDHFANTARHEIWRRNTGKLRIQTNVGVSPSHFVFQVRGIPQCASTAEAIQMVRILLDLPDEVTLSAKATFGAFVFTAGFFHSAFVPITSACSKGASFIFPSPPGFQYMQLEFSTVDRIVPNRTPAHPGPTSSYSSVVARGGLRVQPTMRVQPVEVQPVEVPAVVSSNETVSDMSLAAGSLASLNNPSTEPVVNSPAASVSVQLGISAPVADSAGVQDSLASLNNPSTESVATSTEPAVPSAVPSEHEYSEEIAPEATTAVPDCSDGDGGGPWRLQGRFRYRPRHTIDGAVGN